MTSLDRWVDEVGVLSNCFEVWIGPVSSNGEIDRWNRSLFTIADQSAKFRLADDPGTIDKHCVVREELAQAGSVVAVGRVLLWVLQHFAPDLEDRR